MEHLPSRYLQLYQYILEVFLLWIVIFAISVPRGIEASLPKFLLVALLAYLISFLLFKRLRKSFLPFALPIVAAVTWLLGFDIYQTLLISGVLTARLESRFLKPNQENEEVIFVVTMAISIVAYLNSVLSNFEFANYYLILAACFIFVFFLGRLILYFVSDPEGFGSVKSKKTAWFVSIGVMLFVGTYLLTVSYPYFKWLFGYALYGIVQAISWLFSPIFNLAEWISIDPPENPVTPEEDSMEWGAADQREVDTSFVAHYIHWFLIGIGIAMVLFLLYLFYKYRKKLVGYEERVQEDPIHMEKNKTTEHRLWKRNRSKPPKNAVRKAYYQLEKWAADQGRGRYQDETIEEWLDRRGITGKLRDEVLAQYEKVRYGEREVTEVDSFKENLTTLKQTLTRGKG